MAKITIREISVQNLGPFRHRQTLDLRIGDDKPVILVKALNGSGKTTLLTVLQIGLYGHKAVSNFRRSEYQRLIEGLQRKDAFGDSVIQITISVDIGTSQRELTVTRTWSRKGTELIESLSVYDGGQEDEHYTHTWDDFIGSILPAELVQLFLFDGEKIEALANPEKLPDLLKRATEVFLGIGGIDALTNDLRAYERRTLLRGKKSSTDFDSTRQSILVLQDQLNTAENTLERLTQDQAAARNSLQTSQDQFAKYTVEAKRNGIGAYERAAEIRANAILRQKELEDVRTKLRDLLAHPILPVGWLPHIWRQYKQLWKNDQKSRHAQILLKELTSRDRRILTALHDALPESSLAVLRKALESDRQFYVCHPDHTSNFQHTSIEGPENELSAVHDRLKHTLRELHDVQNAMDIAEMQVGEVPAEEQITGILEKLRRYSKTVADAEATLSSITQRIEETQAQIAHLQARLKSAQARLAKEFQSKSLEAKSLEASARARKTLSLFKDRLLASKAKWLSEVITTEFLNLLRKKNLITKVVVDPTSYHVYIRDRNDQDLPMERLSAGERQLLAISVLSALIKERKGRFPVVVDTPLARLDQQHRTRLIKLFFATVSHQVVILSTDQEVDGIAYSTLKPFTQSEYSLDFDDVSGCTSINKSPVEVLA